MHSFHDSHPLKKLMTAVEQLCDTNYLLPRPDSPLITRVTPPNSSSYTELSTVIEEENEHLLDESSQPDLSGRFFSPLRWQRFAVTSTTQELEHALENLLSLLNTSALQKEIARDPNYYYEDYKALTVYLEYFFADKNENLSSSEAQKISANGLKTLTLQQSRLKSERENEVFLKALLTTYCFHLLMEKVYVDFLRIHYDPAVTRLDKNAPVLFEMMKTHINPSIWLYIQTRQVPRSFCKTKDISNSLEPTHPFSFLSELDQRAMRTNFKRLFLIRFRRFYLSMVACFNTLSASPIFIFLELWLPKIIGLGNVLYFLPRIVSDVLNLFYQVFLVKPKHVETTWIERFNIHFNRRFDVFFRDILWFTNGMLSLLVFTGPIGPWALWVNMIFQWTEMILNLVILNSTKNHFNIIPEMLTDLGLSREHPKMFVIEKELNRRLDIDFRLSYLRMCNSIVISLTSAMILPFFSNISTFIPLAGSIIALIMSYWQYQNNKEVLKIRTTVPDRMFSPEITSINRTVSSANLVLN